MEKEMIAVTTYCIYHKIEPEFIYSLEKTGLIQLANVEDEFYLLFEELRALEQYTRLHYDLDINAEGIDVIHYLLEKIETMQTEIRHLKSRLDVGY
jgi:hypothetical protein